MFHRFLVLLVDHINGIDTQAKQLTIYFCYNAIELASLSVELYTNVLLINRIRTIIREDLHQD